MPTMIPDPKSHMNASVNVEKPLPTITEPSAETPLAWLRSSVIVPRETLHEISVEISAGDVLRFFWEQCHINTLACAS